MASLIHINAGHSLKRKDPSCFSTSLVRSALREVSPAQHRSASAFLPVETSQSRSDTLGPEEQPRVAQLLRVLGACLSTPERIKGHSRVGGGFLQPTDQFASAVCIM